MRVARIVVTALLAAALVAGAVAVGPRLGDAWAAARVAWADRTYSANHNDGAGEPDAVHWVDRTDSSRLVVVAPHAVNHHRDGEPKPADLYTGGIAEVLAGRIGASVLTTTGVVSDWGETWKGRDDEFTRILHSLPDDAVIVDLHGMDDGSATANVSIGTGTEKSGLSMDIAERIDATFDGDTEINETFTAKSSFTVTRHMQERGHDALQVELSSSFRDPGKLNVGDTIDALARALEPI